jgi:hypothetical protein
MSKISSYAFLEDVIKEDTNLLNYYLFPGKYENCPKNNILKNVDVDKMVNENNNYRDHSFLNHKNTYLLNNNHHSYF